MIIDTSCGFIRTCICTWYMIIGMDYHIEQVPMCCRVCGQRLWKSKAKQKISYECNAFTADLKIAFDIDTSGDDVNTHPGRFCLLCKHSMERIISAIMKGVHHKCTVSVFQWHKHTDSQCKVRCKRTLFEQ